MATPLEDLLESSGSSGLPQPQNVPAARPGELLRKADAARDSGRYEEAADGYRKVLELKPGSAGIWVQYGHMLKESGRPDQAQRAYEKALELEPANPDTHLQMGHLYKITNKKISAIEWYGRALKLDPKFREAEKELLALGARAKVSKILEGAPQTQREASTKAQLYFDISDLIFHHFPSNRSPTGIQRIVLAVAEAALEGGSTQDVGLCVLEGDTGKWKPVDSEAALHLMMLSHEGAANSDDAWQSALGDVHRTIWKTPPLRFPKGSTVVSLGAPWGIRRYFAAIRAAKRESGIRCVGYIHDTVPLLYPEYCDGVIPQEFLRWLRRLSRHADLVLANSHSTKRDFQQAFATLGVKAPACEVVYPNGDFSSLFERTGEVSPEVETLQGKPYALFVGTVQPRKNHLMVVSGWRHLVRQLGAQNVPDLVLAGKLGWYWEQLVEFLRKTDNVGGKVRMFNKASDADLQALYKGAMFTIYNSHYEGWGLPVTESLSFGKVPVVSENSALLESGGKYALFYETNSEPSFVDKIQDILRDPGLLTEREKLIQNEQPVRSWAEVFKETRDTIERIFAGKTDQPVPARPVLTPAKIYHFGLIGEQVTESAFADWEFTEDIQVDVSQWWDAEPWGVWTRARTVNLRFELPPALSGEHPNGGSSLMLLLHLRGHRTEAQVTVELNGAPSETFMMAPGADPAVTLRLTPEMVKSGIVELRLEQSALTDLARYTDGQDQRAIGVGFRNFMICREDDVTARLAFLELIAGYQVLALGSQTAAHRGVSLPGSEEEGGFLRLGGRRADVAHAPEELARAAKL